MKRKKDEKGMVIVEATIVFPTMFLVIFLMIFAGNAYLQKCRVESIINEMAIDGAAYCSDPMLEYVAENNSIPGLDDINIRPYRYLIGGMKDIETEIYNKVDRRFRSMSTGLFSNMKPSSPIINVKYNNGFIYSTFSVEIDYKIKMPVRLLGAKDNIAMKLSSRADMPVSNSAEIIRNIDMVEDYMEKFGVTEVTEKIKEMIGKAKEWFEKD